MGNGKSEPVELHRTYPPYTEGRTEAPQDATAVLEAQLTGLKEVADLMRAQLEDVREDRDRRREQGHGGHTATSRSARAQAVVAPIRAIAAGR